MTAPEIDHSKQPKPEDPRIVKAAQQAARTEAAPAPVRRYRALVFQGTLILVATAFTALALLASTTAYFPVDISITTTLQSIRSPLLTTVMSLVSWIGYAPQSIVMTVFVVALIYAVGFQWEAVSAAIASVFVEGLNAAVKYIVHRPRPDADLVTVVTHLNSYSFPSGHVMFYTGFIGFLWFLAYTLLKKSWKRTLLLVIFSLEVLLIGFSRIFLGEHWFSDVIGAYLLGVLSLVVMIFVYRWGKPRYFTHQPVAREPQKIEPGSTGT